MVCWVVLVRSVRIDMERGVLTGGKRTDRGRGVWIRGRIGTTKGRTGKGGLYWYGRSHIGTPSRIGTLRRIGMDRVVLIRGERIDTG